MSGSIIAINLYTRRENIMAEEDLSLDDTDLSTEDSMENES